jgi:hypothetical protein
VADIMEVLAISQYEKDGEKKKRFTKCGVAFPLRDKPGFSMRLDASAVSGEYLIKPKDDRREGGGSGGNTATGGGDIPFMRLD